MKYRIQCNKCSDWAWGFGSLKEAFDKLVQHLKEVHNIHVSYETFDGRDG